MSALSENNRGTGPVHGVISDPSPAHESADVVSEMQPEEDDVSLGAANSQVCKCIPWSKDLGAAAVHIWRLIIRGAFGGIATIALGVLPLSFLTRRAVDDFVEQYGTSFGRKSLDFVFRAEPQTRGTSFLIFWAFCYCIHAGFAGGVLWAVVAVWRGCAGLTRVTSLGVFSTFLLFAYLFSFRAMFVKHHIGYHTMLDCIRGSYIVWAISAFLMFRHLGASCKAALLVIVFGFTYNVCTMLFFHVASRELGYAAVITAGLINHALRSLLVECSVLAGLRFTDVTHGGMMTLLTIAVALSVTVGHAISFCSENMLTLLATQAVHFTMELSRNYGLLRGQTDLDRAVFCIRRVCSTMAALLPCSLLEASSRPRARPRSFTSVTPTDRSEKDLAALGLEGDNATSSEDVAQDCREKTPAELALEGDTAAVSEDLAQDSAEKNLAWQAPEGGSATSPEEPAHDHRQALRKQVLADIISIQNIAELVSLFTMACILPLVKAKLGSTEGTMLPLGLYVLTVFACELFTDFFTAVVSHRWSRGSGSSSSYQSTTTVWNGEFGSTSTQVAALFVMALATVDSACNLVEALCIVQEDGNGGAFPLGPCGSSPFDALVLN